MLASAQDPVSFLEQLALLWDASWDIWRKGGWAMGAIFVNAVIMFGFGVHTLLKLGRKSFRGVGEKTWRLWIAHPEYREGKIGALLDERRGHDEEDQQDEYAVDHRRHVDAAVGLTFVAEVAETSHGGS